MMPDSELNMSVVGADNTTIESLETEGYLFDSKKSDATVKRSVILSTLRNDLSKIVEIKTNMPIEIDSTISKSELSMRDSTKEQTNNFIGNVTDPEEESHFVTGSSYKGSWDVLGMSGIGRYVMPHGTAYEGEIRDGMFHGRGTLFWPKYGRLDVVHHRGKLKEYKYTFTDGLIYDYEDWNYCKFPDRRFYESIKKGLRPCGRTLKTGKQPTKVLPFGCYDVGDGVFDPKTWRITSYDDTKKVLRIPKKEEYDWIIKNCRKSWSEPTGYRLSLNENLSDNPPNLPYHIAMSEDSPDSWWKRLTTFKRQFDPTAEKDNEDISTGTQEKDLPISGICLCGQYVLLGEPCYCVEVPTLADDEAEMDKVAFQPEVHSSNYSSGKSIPQEKCKITLTFERRDSEVESSTRVPEDHEVDIDRLSNISKDSLKYYISNEFLGVDNDLKNRREDGIEAVKIIDERTKSTDAIENETLQKSLADRRKINYGSQLNISKEKIPKKITSQNDEDETQNHVSQQKYLQKFVTESHEAEKKNAQIFGEKISQRRDKNNSAIITYKEHEKMTDQYSLLANKDYATTSIPREKVQSVTEPETNNGRRMTSERSKLLPKGTMTERDLPFDRSDEVAIRSDVIDTPVNNIVSNVTTVTMKMKKNNVDDSDDDKLQLNRSEECIEETQSTRDIYRSIDESKEKSRNFNKIKLMKYPEVSKVSRGASDNFITKEEKFSDIRREEFFSRNLDEQTREMKAISCSSSTLVSPITAKKDSRSRDIEEQMLTERSSISLKYDLPILETLHHYLEDDFSEKQKPMEEMEIIEIYNKNKYSKEKATSKPVNVNVWRLSSSAQRNDQQTNKEDILFHPTLTAPRCELIEYTKEPCGIEACKPALPEVRTGGSLCRKEFPFNIPVKSSCSSAGKIWRKK